MQNVAIGLRRSGIHKRIERPGAALVNLETEQEGGGNRHINPTPHPNPLIFGYGAGGEGPYKVPFIDWPPVLGDSKRSIWIPRIFLNFESPNARMALTARLIAIAFLSVGRKYSVLLMLTRFVDPPISRRQYSG